MRENSPFSHANYFKSQNAKFEDVYIGMLQNIGQKYVKDSNFTAIEIVQNDEGQKQIQLMRIEIKALLAPSRDQGERVRQDVASGQRSNEASPDFLEGRSKRNGVTFWFVVICLKHNAFSTTGNCPYHSFMDFCMEFIEIGLRHNHQTLGRSSCPPAS